MHFQFFQLHLVYFVLVFWTCVHFYVADGRKNTRQGKIFSLFNIVTFEQNTCNCLSDSSIQGTCMTKMECENSDGGQMDGQCAAGFGHCCMMVKNTPTALVTRNTTYLQNAEAVGRQSVPTGYTFTFNRIANDLCQIRLDFDVFVSASPPVTGDCATSMDTLIIRSPTGRNPPVTCGTLSGQHMYFETGDTGSAGEVMIKFGASMPAKTFRIKTTYYECDNLNKAPTDCVQYLTGLNGAFQSYNFQGGQLINNQNYVTCIRREMGHCSIQYAENASTTSPAFNLPPESTTAQISMCEVGLHFGSTLSGTGTNCGGVLNSVEAATEPGVVIGTLAPFQVTTLSGDVLKGTNALAGYSIRYTQIPC
ncbi:uncharacterized protein LOC131883678 isoform X2 [Tigriopus californicus]|nr:uncharacterized protein LOC131883678 isoform X2 [Tigriopus californicus]